MHVVHLKITGFRGVNSANIALGRHAVLVGPNNSGKTTLKEIQGCFSIPSVNLRLDISMM